MAFDWSGFLVVARTLSAATDEAAQRSAMSRAYYAAFHHARRHVDAKWGVQHRSGRGDDHRAVWEMLTKQHGATRQEKQAGFEGIRLKKLRTDADYEDEIAACAANAALAVAQAEKICALLR